MCGGLARGWVHWTALALLAIGAVRPGQAICQANATWAGVALWVWAMASSAASTWWPC